jgi:GNAT superfamily N-acetyltransferase
VTSFTTTAATTLTEARKLLVGATPPNGSFTQESNFSVEKIDRALRLGFRRPAWVWYAADSEGGVLGVVAGWGAASRTTADILDFLDLPADIAVARALLDRAVADSAAPGRKSMEIIHFLPSEQTFDEPALASLIETVGRAEFRILVRRHRYRLDVVADRVTVPATLLRFEPITGPNDPRLVRVLREVLVGSLDAHDRVALETGDLDTVAIETASEFLEYDPADSFFLARDENGEIVGLVVGGLRGSPEIGVASFIGVSHRHRGRGYAAQLLGWMTARLIGQNARVVIGETDDENFPMAAAFTSVGYPHTESRIDFRREL